MTERATRTLPSVTVLLLAGGLVAGCAASPRAIDDAKRRGFEYDLLALGAYRTDDPARAAFHWRQAIEALEPGGKVYLDGGLFRDHSTYLANIAVLDLERGDPEAAKRHGIDALVALQAGEWNAARLEAERERFHVGLADALQIGALIALGMLGGYQGPISFELGGEDREAGVRLPGPLDVASNGRPLPHLDDPPADADAIRLPVQAPVGPLSSIGRIGELGRCSATLIGPSLALTTAACVGDPGTPEPVVFETAGTRDSVRIVETVSPDKAGEDGWPSGWALLRLDRHPLRRGWLDVLPPEEVDRRIDRGARLIVVGYGDALNDRRFMVMDWGCEARSGDERALLLHRCGPWTANSGGGAVLLFDAVDQSLSLAGVNAGRWIERPASEDLGADAVADLSVAIRSRAFYDAFLGLRSAAGPHQGARSASIP